MTPAPSAGLPRWCTPLLDAEQMRAVDNWTIERGGVPSLDLMELAGTSIARAALEPAPEGPIVIVCGKGNNGGDGLVAARVLRDWRDRLGDKQVEVILFGDPDELSPDAAVNLERLPGDPPHALDRDLIARAGVIVDAMLGTGTTGAPRGELAEAVMAINARAGGARVIAVDAPTGVDASTGEVAGEAVHADLTVALHSAKLGHYVAPGTLHCGEVRVADIGIPSESASGAGIVAAAGTIGAQVLKTVPPRTDASSKFDSGSLAVVGGSTGLTGAPCLAALAAQRTGAGYVTAFVPASLNLVFEQRLLEAMTVPLADDVGALTPGAVDDVLARTRQRTDALVVGPGLGRADGTLAFVRDLLAASDLPAVVDADALFAFNDDPAALRRQAPTVITPHAGELGRLLGVESSEVADHRLACAARAVELTGAVVVLKGADTIVAAPGRAPMINPLRAPGLATAGTGDVLAGMIGALLAKRMDALEAAAAAVYAHALGGREASERRGSGHVIASDVIDALPMVLD